MSLKPILMFCLASVVSAWAQTPNDLAAKYPVVAVYEVRPGILMTAHYGRDGQVCEAILEKRHYISAEDIDLSSTISSKLRDELLDELAPPSERGPESKWLTSGSYIAGGVSHLERNFENVLVETDGDVSTGDKVVIIHWKQRTCAAPKQNTGLGAPPVSFEAYSRPLAGPIQSK